MTVTEKVHYINIEILHKIIKIFAELVDISTIAYFICCMLLSCKFPRNFTLGAKWSICFDTTHHPFYIQSVKAKYFKTEAIFLTKQRYNRSMTVIETGHYIVMGRFQYFS